MTEQKKAETSKPAKAPAKRSLSPAAGSSDPAVHLLLARIGTARSNDNADEVERLTKALADLGYE